MKKFICNDVDSEGMPIRGPLDTAKTVDRLSAAIGALNKEDTDNAFEHLRMIQPDDLPEEVARRVSLAKDEIAAGAVFVGKEMVKEALVLLVGERRETSDTDQQLPESICDDGSIAGPMPWHEACGSYHHDSAPCHICNPPKAETTEQRRRRLLREAVRLQLAAWDAARALEKETGYDIADEDIIDLIGGARNVADFTDEVLDEFFSNYQQGGSYAN